MKIIDMHVHTYVDELDVNELVKKLDEAGIYASFIYSSAPTEESELRGFDFDRRLRQLKNICSKCPERLLPVMRLHPDEENLEEKVRISVKNGVVAFKLIPSNYYPYEEKCLSLCRLIAKTGKPVIFHSGVLYSDKKGLTSDYCRPMNFEALHEIEGLRFALAHCSWPWIDECLALYGRFNFYAARYAKEGTKPCEMFLDLTPGTPAIYRKELVEKLYSFPQCTADNLLYGSDCVAERYSTSDILGWIKLDTKIMDNIGVSFENQKKLFHDNTMRFLGTKGYEVEVRAWGWKCYNEKVRDVIEKWYKKLEFPKEYDSEFYAALEEYNISDAIDISTYDLNEKDGRRNLLSFLFMCEKLSQQYREKGIDENIMLHTVKDIVLWTNAWSEVKGEMYLGELNWLSNHFNMRLFRLGNLEFMLKKFHTDFPEFGITKDDYLIDVHIPNDAKFGNEECVQSFRMAKEFFKKHYPELELKYFTCESWLLDRELEKLLPETSNIIRFGRRFEVIPEETTEDFAALRYVFKWNTNRLNLKIAVCTSGFSERLKKHVLSGEKLYSVTGVFSVDEID